MLWLISSTLVISLLISALTVFEIGTNEQRAACNDRGGEYVRTGPSRYICMAKECLK